MKADTWKNSSNKFVKRLAIPMQLSNFILLIEFFFGVSNESNEHDNRVVAVPLLDDNGKEQSNKNKRVRNNCGGRFEMGTISSELYLWMPWKKEKDDDNADWWGNRTENEKPNYFFIGGKEKRNEYMCDANRMKICEDRRCASCLIERKNKNNKKKKETMISTGLFDWFVSRHDCSSYFLDLWIKLMIAPSESYNKTSIFSLSTNHCLSRFFVYFFGFLYQFFQRSINKTKRAIRR